MIYIGMYKLPFSYVRIENVDERLKQERQQVKNACYSFVG
jgi:hypothetical protein